MSTFYVSSELHLKVKRAAVEAGRPMQEIVQEAIEAFLRRPERILAPPPQTTTNHKAARPRS